MLMCALLLPIAHETAGAARIRHSLRPLFGEGEEYLANLGRIGPRDRESVFVVWKSKLKIVFVVPALSRDPYAAAYQ
jgi:hypothetical protein